MDIDNWIMDIVHNWIRDMYKWIIDNHDGIMDIYS